MSVVDVTDYGAVGDGVTDDTEAIQRAIDALIEAGGGELYLSGTHLLSGPLIDTAVQGGGKEPT